LSNVTEKPYITCRELISFLADYIEQTLPPETLYEFERHLNVCPSCVAYVASYRETIVITRRANVSPKLLQDEAPAELIAAILASAKRDL
jgi:anti-sigma factor RsiW